MTTPPDDPPDRSGFKSEDDIDKVLGYANPNPDRVGCPPHDALAALARRERPIGDLGYEHIVNCSPCYREFRSLQQANAVTTEQLAQTRRRWQVVAAAAVVFALVGMGAWLLLTQRQAVDAPRVAQSIKQTPELPTQLDLRKYSVTRSEGKTVTQPVLELPRARLDLTMLLPVGSEPGAYDVQVLDSDLRSRATATGSAEIRNYITTLRTTLDVQELPAGSYQLAVRRQGEEWQMFPANVR